MRGSAPTTLGRRLIVLTQLHQSIKRKSVMSLPSVEELKGKWKQQVGSAKVTWGKLTEDELLQSEGHAEKLTGLVEERYAISHAEAEKQVKSFFDKTK
ncbi:MAG: hypothetical protein ACI9EB_001150 [Pseudomonas sp.]|jgi:uncharacterized protein YjbJ (UPF0337 family)